jgi:hypothetical protein
MEPPTGMNESDLGAIYDYLRTAPPVHLSSRSGPGRKSLPPPCPPSEARDPLTRRERGRGED